MRIQTKLTVDASALVTIALFATTITLGYIAASESEKALSKVPIKDLLQSRH
jgi:hypothetical protein